MEAKNFAHLRATVDGACSDTKKGIPGATVVVVGKNGQELFAHSAGKLGVDSDQPMTLDSIFWIASCTKMLAGMACMHAVERGLLALDDGAQIEKLLPELKDIKVLTAEGKYEEKKTAITLRMLLSHTSGFSYTFFNERLRKWGLPAGIDEFSGRIDDMKSPLMFQPGTDWEYGVSIAPRDPLLPLAECDVHSNTMNRWVLTGLVRLFTGPLASP
jgi:CubicO group peptidase (beta-lactamase class C family)